MIHDHWWAVVDKATHDPHPAFPLFPTRAKAADRMKRKKEDLEGKSHVIIKVKECRGTTPKRRDERGRRLWWWVIVESDTFAPLFLSRVYTCYRQVKGVRKFKHVRTMKVIPT